MADMPEPEVRRRARQQRDHGCDAREPAQLRGERDRLLAGAKGPRYFGDSHRPLSVDTDSMLQLRPRALLRFLSGRPGSGCPVPPFPVCRDCGSRTHRRGRVFAFDDRSYRRFGLGGRCRHLGRGGRPRRRSCRVPARPLARSRPRAPVRSLHAVVPRLARRPREGRGDRARAGGGRMGGGGRARPGAGPGGGPRPRQPGSPSPCSCSRSSRPLCSSRCSTASGRSSTSRSPASSARSPAGPA